jgi:leucyl-tRNA---protein transferase
LRFEIWSTVECPVMANPKEVRLTMFPAHPCAYLPPREARSRGFACARMPGEVYQQLMDAGFRRSGLLVYQPACVGCRECRPLRVPVAGFIRSVSQRRTWKKNSDLVVTVAEPKATQEKYELYARYMRERHGREEDATAEAFATFLYESPVETLEMEYRDAAGKLVAVGICDRLERALSSVYFYYNPSEHRRGLGTYGVLWEIEYARARGLAFYYLGYWVRGCAAMEYKASFGPHEILGEDGLWREGMDRGVG